MSRLRAYHLLPAQYALDDLRHRRLKIARVEDLNDPFDLWALAQPERSLRTAIRGYREEMSRRFGMLCFSLSWQNPLLWSHYAERHRGVALGFDLDEGKIKRVSYAQERPTLRKVDLQVVHDLLYTKYVDWRYEQEVRVFTSLDDVDPLTGLYFADFNDDCVLREVIVGSLSKVTESDLRDALGEHQGQVTVTKARLAFNSFNVVKNQLGFPKEP